MVGVSKKLDHYTFDILTQLDKKFFNLNKVSAISCVQYSYLKLNVRRYVVFTAVYQLQQLP